MAGFLICSGRLELAQPECSPLANYTCRRGYGISPAGLTGLTGSDYWFDDLI